MVKVSKEFCNRGDTVSRLFVTDKRVLFKAFGSSKKNENTTGAECPLRAKLSLNSTIT